MKLQIRPSPGLMPAHSVLISLAEGLPAGCARATEPDRNSPYHYDKRRSHFCHCSLLSEIKRGQVRVSAPSQLRTEKSFSRLRP